MKKSVGAVVRHDRHAILPADGKSVVTMRHRWRVLAAFEAVNEGQRGNQGGQTQIFRRQEKSVSLGIVW